MKIIQDSNLLHSHSLACRAIHFSIFCNECQTIFTPRHFYLIWIWWNSRSEDETLSHLINSSASRLAYLRINCRRNGCSQKRITTTMRLNPIYFKYAFVDCFNFSSSSYYMFQATWQQSQQFIQTPHVLITAKSLGCLAWMVCWSGGRGGSEWKEL